jgi:hypothetical protein
MSTVLAILVDEEIGRPHRPHHERDDGAAREEGPAHRAGQGQRPMLRARGHESIRHGVERGIPRDFFPAVGTALADAPHGMQQAFIAVGDFRKSTDPLDAKRAPRSRVSRVGIDAGHASVVNMGKRPAAG